MSFELRSWPREYFEPGGARPYVLFYAYGNFAELPTMPVDKYRSFGVPKGLDLQMYNRQQHAEVMDAFLGGHFGQFLHQKQGIEAGVRAARHCIVLKGEPADDTTLDYLRDAVGVLRYLLDYGAECILDPQTLTWWSPSEWVELYDADSPLPAKHVTVLGSPEEGSASLWLHTRGLRKFGRPDLSVHQVEESHRATMLELIERFVNFQAFGGIIEEGEEVNADVLPSGLKCLNQGDLDDPDFNNSHVELKWVGAAVAD